VIVGTEYNQKGELMKKLVLVAVFLLGFSVMAMAQDVPVAEIYGGYSLTMVDVDTLSGGEEDQDLSLHGWNASVTFNMNKWAGIVGEFTGSYGTLDTSADYPDGVKAWVDVKFNSIMIGPKVTLHRGTVSPFVHALVGYAHLGYKAVEDGTEMSETENDLAMAFGGGVDVRLNDNLSIRPVQLDYFTTRGRVNGEFADHFRYSAGFIVKLGKH
jgi:opacity protein-like surface antigen